MEKNSLGYFSKMNGKQNSGSYGLKVVHFQRLMPLF